MSSHYIYLSCPAPDCSKFEQIYTGNVYTNDFPDSGPRSFEGESIETPCNEHLDWEPEPVQADEQESLPSDDEVLEYGFVLDSPQVAGLMAVTRNPMIAEVMSAARPEQPTFQRPWTPWTVVPGKEGQ